MVNLQTIIAACTLVGVLTTYAGKYVGEPLYCDRGCGLVYSEAIAFIAMPVGEFESGRVQCGDWVLVTTPGGSFWAQALDAGPLERFRVEQFGNLPIIGDIPEHLWTERGISAPGRVFNESAFNRLSADAKMGHLGYSAGNVARLGIR